MKMPDPLVSEIDPPMAGFLAELAGHPPMESLTPEAARALFRALSAMPGPPPPPVASVRELRLPAGGCALRLYTPMGVQGPTPLLLYLHGGGWVFGDLDSYDGVCRTLCHDAGIVVASLDYRLAPEHPFPGALDDAEAALRWLHAQAADLGCDPTRLAVAGDSAGAQLAATAAIRVAGEVPVSAAGLIYPVAYPLTTPTRAKRENGEGKLLTNGVMRWATHHYVGPDVDAQAHPEVALLRSRRLSILPPCWVATLGHDPLRDDGLDLVATLREAAVPVRHLHESAGVHGCLTLPSLSPVGPRMLIHLAAWLRETV